MKSILAKSSSLTAFRAIALSTVLLLAACSTGDDDGTPTPTNVAEAPPTVPAATATVNTNEIEIVSPPVATRAPGTPVAEGAASTPEPMLSVATPAPAPTLIAAPTLPSTEGTADVIASPAPGATPGATATSEGWTHSAGDGTGGSGAPGEQEPGELQAAASPAASPVTMLVVVGCEVPDAPVFDQPVNTFTVIDDVNFRSGPGTECAPVAEDGLGIGQTVTVVGGPVTQSADNSVWVQIDVDGVIGWVSFEYLEPVEP